MYQDVGIDPTSPDGHTQELEWVKFLSCALHIYRWQSQCAGVVWIPITKSILGISRRQLLKLQNSCHL